MSAGVRALTRLGRYELLARIATGGMGEIFLARLEGAAGFEKLYAVKRVLPHLAQDERFRAMLIAEASITSKLSHANICQIYELGETDGQLYIAMEYLEGVTVYALLRKASKTSRPLAFGLIAAIVQQTCDALHYAHELRDRKGEPLAIVHRDVTPANIFLTDAGVAKLLDFGIAKARGASAQTQTGTVKGKYAYMAPEQLSGSALDRRTDIFAVGVVTFEMLALRRLFQRKTDYLTFRAVMEQPIPDVRRYRPDAPEPLALALAGILDRSPDQRPRSARQLASELMNLFAAIERPWTQGEISDFVRETFREELKERSEQLASIFNRTKPSAPTRPMITDMEGDPTVTDHFDDEEFPPVETVETDVFEGRAPPAVGARSTTPPPFSADSSPSVVQYQPLPAAIDQSAPVALPHRTLLWPIVAFGMLCIAGGALVLLWRQAPPQPTIVNITSEPATGSASERRDAGLDADAIPDAAAAGSQVGATGVKPRPIRPRSPYDAAIRRQRAKINQCARLHGAPPGDASLVILVATSGAAESVSLVPQSFDRAPLGACIKTVLRAVKYPTSDKPMRVTVPLKATTSE